MPDLFGTIINLFNNKNIYDYEKNMLPQAQLKQASQMKTFVF